ncbi:hypothetical protein VU12_01570 [Desulfobulbus sp. US4]|nr:hypothetical protein [Desulfobulbus sp. US4]
MNKTTTTRFDIAEHLRTPEEMAAYLEATLEEAGGDVAFIAKALGDVARAQRQEELGADFMSLAGLWQGRDVTQDAIRKKAWPRQNNNPEQYHGMGRSHK